VQNRIEKIEKILASRSLDIMFARVASNLLKRDNVEEAIQICEHGLKKFSTYAQGHYILAKCYQKKGMSAEARAEFERVLKFDFNHLNALKELAGIYKTAGLKDYHKEFILRLFTLDPLNTDLVNEVKALGIYDEWVAVKEPVRSAIPAKIPAAQDSGAAKPGEQSPGSRTSGSPPVTPARPANNLYERDKVDLSQFNNLRDDFTTILQGKNEAVPPDQTQPLQNASTAREDKTDWVEEITYSYGDDTLNEVMKSESGMDSGEEKIEAALRDLTFDEETEKILDATQLKTDTPSADQIALDFEDDSVGAEKMQQDETVTSAGMEPPATESGLAERRRPAFIDSQRSILSGDEEEEELPFKPPKIISQTLGEILVSQKKYNEALEVFRTLKQKYPQNKNFDKKIEFLQKIIALDNTSGKA
jgi:tetratricopeptide (TPR) repeat protein